MKIYILPVHETLQPSSTRIRNPNHNDDYGVEQDFLKFLQVNHHLIAKKPQKADFHYLPVYWNRWLYNYDWSQNKKEILQSYVSQAIIDDAKTFTICQPSLGTIVNIGRTLIFWASRNKQTAIDIPLICKPHKIPVILPKKKYLISFVGSIDTHPIRKEIVECFKDLADACIVAGHKKVNLFLEKIFESYITLCPRGVGGSFYRFFETMQLGGVPFFIGDLDTRPFKKYIDWDDYSFYAESPKQALETVKNCKKNDLLSLGKQCAQLWKDHLNYGKWCHYVLEELSDLEK
jgi:hypothetical protein